MAINPYINDLPPRYYLREWRDQRGLTQAALGKLAGTTGGTIGRYEKGERGLEAEMLLKLVDALDILPGQLFAPPEAPHLDAFARGLSRERRRKLLELVKTFVEEKDSS